MRSASIWLTALAFLLYFPNWAAAQTFTTTKGTVKFTSDAPMEVIKANSSQLTAAINLEKKTFVFSLPIKSFEGFTGGGLQRQHFNEQYMESDKYPTATYKGSFETDADLTQNGSYNVKAIGNFDIHGVTKAYTIMGTLQNTGKQVMLNASFDIRLADHKIDIPTLVTKKLAEVVRVTVSANLDAK